MAQPGLHAMLPQQTHDEAARGDFLTTMRQATVHMSRFGLRPLYDERVEPAFRKQHGRPPKNRHEIRKAMQDDPLGQLASGLRLLTQEMKFDAMAESVERQLPALVETAKRLGSSNRKRGTLMLDPSLTIPRYVDSVDIHGMPGGYFAERMDDDVMAGALYDRSVFIRTSGAVGPYMDVFGLTSVAYIKSAFPDLKVHRVLDVGCSVGHSTLPFCDAWPGVEVHGIDVAAPMLRYAHARAESMDRTVHFSQQNAERSNYPDGFFDVVIGHAMLHETSTAATRNILKEAHRLLAPGGLCLHFEAPPWNHMSEFEASVHDWDTHFNAEPFIGKLHDLDPKKLMTDAGFAAHRCIDTYVPAAGATQFVGTVGGNKSKGTFWYFGARK